MRVVGFAPRRSPLALAALGAAGLIAWRVHDRTAPVVHAHAPHAIAHVTPAPPQEHLTPAPGPLEIQLRATYLPSAIRRPYCGNADVLVHARFRPTPGHGELTVLVPCALVDGVVYDGPAPGPLVLEPGAIYDLTLIATDDGRLRATDVALDGPLF